MSANKQKKCMSFRKRKKSEPLIVDLFILYLVYRFFVFYFNSFFVCIDGVMLSVLASCEADRGLEPL